MELIKLLSSLQGKLMKVSRLTIDNLQLTTDMFRALFGQMSNVKCQMSRRHGQSLIEVVIAMAVIVGLAVALVTMTLVVQKTSRSAKNNTQATKLVQQNIEQIRIYRDRFGYSLIPTGPQCYKLSTPSSDPSTWSFPPAFSCDDKTNAQQIALNNIDFFRQIMITEVTDPVTGAKTKQVKVTVFWTDSGGTQSVSNQTILSSGL